MYYLDLVYVNVLIYEFLLVLVDENVFLIPIKKKQNEISNKKRKFYLQEFVNV